MINLKFIPTQFSLFLVLGIILGYYFEFSAIFLIALVLTSIIALIYFKYRANNSFEQPSLFTVFTAICFLSIGIISIQLQHPKNQKSHYINNYSHNNQIVIKVRSILKPSKIYQKYEAEVIQVNGKPTKGTILLNMNQNGLTDVLKVDDLLLSYHPLQEINKALNPNEFDYSAFLKKKGIYKKLNLKNKEYIHLRQGNKTLKGSASQLRLKINKALKKYDFSPNELAIINAILLGQRNDIHKDLFENYKNAGAIHILAVSGLHIGIILLLLNFIFHPLERLKHGKAIKLILVIISLWVFAFIAGMSASVIRAVTMFTAITIGWMSDRPSNVKNSLVVSFFFLLLIHPLFLFDVGFQLSYAAVFSIVLIQPLLSNLWQPKLKLVNYFWQLLTVSFAAQLGILPLSLYYFHQFPGLFFVSSLVIIPFLGIIIGFGIIVILLALLQVLPLFLANIYGFIISLMNKFVAFISHQESFVFHNIYFSILMLIVFYLFLISVIHFFAKHSIQRLILVLITIVMIQTSFIYQKLQTKNMHQFIVFQQIKKTVIAVKDKSHIHFYYNPDSIKTEKNRVISSYLSGLFSSQSVEIDSLKNVYQFNHKYFYIVDDSGIYRSLKFTPETVILTQSPKINLNRLINEIHPKLIIADGSNYKNYINRWKNTCKNQQVNFYATSNEGAFVSSFVP